MSKDKNNLELFADILNNEGLTSNLAENQDMENYIRYLINGSISVEERELIDKHKLTKWLFPQYYSDVEKRVLENYIRFFGKIEGKVALYGVGPMTRLILNNLCCENVIGVMCTDQQKTQICGKKIISEFDAIESGVRNIIVISRIANYEIITKRIYRFCINHQITLKGLNGYDLLQNYGMCIVDKSINDYYATSYEQVREEIRKHEIISFDVFDTLIMRKTFYPQDVFYLVGQEAQKQNLFKGDFHQERINAELHNRYECNIYGIYRTLKENCLLTDKQMNCLLELEIEIEKKILLPRDSVVKLFHTAIEMGKRVFLISDMYLPKEILLKLLCELRITGYENLYVSCDVGTTKGQELFDYFKNITGGNSYLHLGDNKASDVEGARKKGIDSIWLMSARDMLEISSASSLLHEMKSINDRNLIGLMISRTLNNPFILNKSNGFLEIESTDVFGYIFFGAYVVCYFLWLFQTLRDESVEKMLFPSRDGSLFFELYNWCKFTGMETLLPDAEYFLTSRKLCYKMSYRDKADIEYMLKEKQEYTPEQLLEECFSLDKQEIKPYTPNEYLSIQEYVLVHEKQIVHKSNEICKAYKNYMNTIGLKSNIKYGLFDSYCNGTIQYLLEMNTDYKWVGLYLGKKHGHIEPNIVKTLYNNRDAYTDDNTISSRYTLLEKVFTSNKTSVKGILENGSFIYAEENRTMDELNWLDDVQTGITEFFKDFMENLYIYNELANKRIPDQLFLILGNTNLAAECYGKHGLYIFNDMTGRNIEIHI